MKQLKNLLLKCAAMITLVVGTYVNAFAQKTKTIRTIIIDAGHGGSDIGARGSNTNEATVTLQLALQLRDRLQQVLPDVKIILTRDNEELPGGVSDHNEANRIRARIANENKGDLFISIHCNSAQTRYKSTIVGYKTETYYTGKGKKRKKRTRQVPVYHREPLGCAVHGTETYIWAINKNDIKRKYANATAEEFGEQSGVTQEDDDPIAQIQASLRTKQFFDRSLRIAELVEEEFVKQGRRSLGVKQRNHTGIWVLQATAMPSILVETGFICNDEEETYMMSEKGQQEITYAIMRAVLRYKEFLAGR